jgi:nucleoside 2-deoxyribosyltransferase
VAKNIISYDVLISCPGDIEEEIDVIKEVIEQFNNNIAVHSNIRLEAKHWSKNSYPQSGGKAQALLNKQFIDECDMAIAVLWTKFGTPTDEYDSGTEEEIIKMLNQNKQVFLYFSNKPIHPTAINQDQYNKVRQFKEKYATQGIYHEYNNLEHFRLMLQNHLCQHICGSNIEYLKDGTIESKTEQNNNTLNKISFNELLIDVRNYYSKVKTDGLAEHIKYTYLEKMTQNIKDHIFDKLWEITFISDDDEANCNRDTNAYIMKCLVEENREYYLEHIKKIPEKYSSIQLSNLKLDYTEYSGHNITSPISAIIHFLSYFNEYYSVLTRSAQNLINVELKRNFYYQVRATFLSETLEKHLEMIHKRINEVCSNENGYYWVEGYNMLFRSDVEFLMNKGAENNCIEVVQEYIIKYFLGSPCYSGATSIYSSIKPFIPNFNKQQIEKLLNGMQNNNQIYDNYEYRKMYNYVVSFS